MNHKSGISVLSLLVPAVLWKARGLLQLKHVLKLWASSVQLKAILKLGLQLAPKWRERISKLKWVFKEKKSHWVMYLWYILKIGKLVYAFCFRDLQESQVFCAHWGIHMWIEAFAGSRPEPWFWAWPWHLVNQLESNFLLHVVLKQVPDLLNTAGIQLLHWLAWPCAGAQAPRRQLHVSTTVSFTVQLSCSNTQRCLQQG